MLLGQMQEDFGGFDTAVPQVVPHCLNINPIHHQIAGKGMPEERNHFMEEYLIIYEPM